MVHQPAGNELLPSSWNRLRSALVRGRVRNGMLEPINTFSTKTERQPATLTADAVKISGMHGDTNTIEYLAPGNATAHAQAKFSQHGVILVLHFLLRPISVQRATGKPPMRTGSAHGIGTIENFDHGLRMDGEHSMDRSHVIDKSRTVPHPAKSLQAQECVRSEADRI